MITFPFPFQVHHINYVGLAKSINKAKTSSTRQKESEGKYEFLLIRCKIYSMHDFTLNAIQTIYKHAEPGLCSSRIGFGCNRTHIIKTLVSGFIQYEFYVNM